jgi:hypothetical protein
MIDLEMNIATLGSRNYLKVIRKFACNLYNRDIVNWFVYVGGSIAY